MTRERTFLQLFKIPRDHRVQITQSHVYLKADITVRRKQKSLKMITADKNAIPFFYSLSRNNQAFIQLFLIY